MKNDRASLPGFPLSSLPLLFPSYLLFFSKAGWGGEREKATTPLPKSTCRTLLFFSSTTTKQSIHASPTKYLNGLVTNQDGKARVALSALTTVKGFSCQLLSPCKHLQLGCIRDLYQGIPCRPSISETLKSPSRHSVHGGAAHIRPFGHHRRLLGPVVHSNKTKPFPKSKLTTLFSMR